MISTQRRTVIETRQIPRKPYYKIASLEKGLKIIELLSEKQNLTVTEVAKTLGQDRSASNRLLFTLRDLGYVVSDSRARYRLTLKLFEISNQPANILDIRSIARAYMRKLADLHKQTVNLGLMDGHDVVIIDVVSGQEFIKFDAPIGNRSPAHTLAMGKAMLAFLPQDQHAAYLDSAVFQEYTPNTITDKETFKNELEKVYKQGYALDNEEWAFGVSCVASPVFDFTDYPSYAISVSGPSHRLTDEKVARIARDLTRLCKSLSNELGVRKI